MDFIRPTEIGNWAYLTGLENADFGMVPRGGHERVLCRGAGVVPEMSPGVSLH